MGKGFNNYMCKKFFHPASRDNLKRVWMAEQKAESYKKKQEELRVQYEKEQDLYTNKAMLSKESKDKLSVNFMYEPPPGTKKEREREDDEPEYKFEWQRKFNAPREDYCKGDSEIRDQPFGIQVRNVRCIKCHKWGHINTDKECPMYNQSSTAESSNTSMDPLLLVQQMREDGLAMKRSALGLHIPLQNLQKNGSDNDTLKASEIDLLKSLTKKQKQKLLKKFNELEKRNTKKTKKGKKKSKKRKCKKDHSSNSTSNSSDCSSGNSDSDSDCKSKKKRKYKNKKGKESLGKRKHHVTDSVGEDEVKLKVKKEDASSDSQTEHNHKKHKHANSKIKFFGSKSSKDADVKKESLKS